jgi:nickel-dependent lactate racemase
MKVRLDYGRAGLDVTLPDDVRATVVEASKGAPLARPVAAVEQALAQPTHALPLATLARRRRDAVVVISDKTRPVPYGIVLPPLLRVLEAAGIPRQRTEILVATGLHRANVYDELVEMTSADIVAGYRIRNHVARAADAHTHLGQTSRGTEIWIDSSFLAADLKIVTGLIEPHLMAGFSGGRKAVAPGLAGVDTMRSAHGPAMLEGNVGPGILEGNPFHEDLLEIARRAHVDFLVDVSIDRQRRLTGVFAGDIEQAHAAGAAAVEQQVRVDLDAAADIVIVSAAGYPLDATFYQSIKGLTASLNVVRRGGTIILAAELSEGVGGSEFQELLRDIGSNDAFMARITTPGFFRIDQWMAQHLCQVLRKAEVVLVSDRLPPDALPGCVARARRVEEALAAALRRHGPHARVAVLPEGPYVLATVRGCKLSLGRAWMDQAATDYATPAS